MNYRTCQAEDLFLVRWYKTDTASLEEIEWKFATACRAASRPLVYVSISADDTPPPDDTTRKKMLAGVDVILKDTNHFYVVLDSRGFRGSVQRTAMAGLMLLFKHSRQIKVCAGIEEVISDLRTHKIIVNPEKVRGAMEAAQM